MADFDDFSDPAFPSEEFGDASFLQETSESSEVDFDNIHAGINVHASVTEMTEEEEEYVHDDNSQKDDESDFINDDDEDEEERWLRQETKTMSQSASGSRDYEEMEDAMEDGDVSEEDEEEVLWEEVYDDDDEEELHNGDEDDAEEVEDDDLLSQIAQNSTRSLVDRTAQSGWNNPSVTSIDEGDFQKRKRRGGGDGSSILRDSSQASIEASVDNSASVDFDLGSYAEMSSHASDRKEPDNYERACREMITVVHPNLDPDDMIRRCDLHTLYTNLKKEHRHFVRKNKNLDEQGNGGDMWESFVDLDNETGTSTFFMGGPFVSDGHNSEHDHDTQPDWGNPIGNAFSEDAFEFTDTWGSIKESATSNSTSMDLNAANPLSSFNTFAESSIPITDSVGFEEANRLPATQAAEISDDDDDDDLQQAEKWLERHADDPEDYVHACRRLSTIIFRDDEDHDNDAMLKRTNPKDLYRYLKQQYWYLVHTGQLEENMLHNVSTMTDDKESLKSQDTDDARWKDIEEAELHPDVEVMINEAILSATNVSEQNTPSRSVRETAVENFKQSLSDSLHRASEHAGTEPKEKRNENLSADESQIKPKAKVKEAQDLTLPGTGLREMAADTVGYSELVTEARLRAEEELLLELQALKEEQARLLAEDSRLKEEALRLKTGHQVNALLETTEIDFLSFHTTNHSPESSDSMLEITYTERTKEDGDERTELLQQSGILIRAMSSESIIETDDEDESSSHEEEVGLTSEDRDIDRVLEPDDGNIPMKRETQDDGHGTNKRPKIAGVGYKESEPEYTVVNEDETNIDDEKPLLRGFQGSVSELGSGRDDCGESYKATVDGQQDETEDIRKNELSEVVLDITETLDEEPIHIEHLKWKSFETQEEDVDAEKNAIGKEKKVEDAEEHVEAFAAGQAVFVASVLHSETQNGSLDEPAIFAEDKSDATNLEESHQKSSDYAASYGTEGESSASRKELLMESSGAVETSSNSDESFESSVDHEVNGNHTYVKTPSSPLLHDLPPKEVVKDVAELEWRRKKIKDDLDDLIQRAEEEELGDLFSSEARAALKIGSQKVALIKKYYDEDDEKYIHYPSVAKTIYDFSLIEEAEKYYRNGSEEFPLDYSSALCTIAASQLRGDATEVNENEDYIQETTQDVWLGDSNLDESVEMAMRNSMIEIEINTLILDAEQQELDCSLQPDVSLALKHAAFKVAYVKKYFDSKKDEYVYFPSVAKSTYNFTLIEEAERILSRNGGTDLDEVYKNALCSVAASYLRGNVKEVDEDDEYVKSTAVDVPLGGNGLIDDKASQHKDLPDKTFGSSSEAPTEQEKRMDKIMEELDCLIKEAQETDIGGSFDDEAVKALNIAACKLVFVKKFFEVTSDEFVYFPSVARTILNYSLIEEAKHHYYRGESEFPLEYTSGLRAAAARALQKKGGIDETDDYVVNMTVDVKLDQEVEVETESSNFTIVAVKRGDADETDDVVTDVEDDRETTSARTATTIVEKGDVDKTTIYSIITSDVHHVGQEFNGESNSINLSTDRDPATSISGKVEDEVKENRVIGPDIVYSCDDSEDHTADADVKGINEQNEKVSAEFDGGSQDDDRTKMVKLELSRILSRVEEAELEEPLEIEAVVALKRAALEVCYLKMYYDVLNNNVVYFPSVARTLLDYSLIEAAESSYFEGTESFPSDYTACLRAVAIECVEDYDYDYMEKLATDVNEAAPMSPDESDEADLSWNTSVHFDDDQVFEVTIDEPSTMKNTQESSSAVPKISEHSDEYGDDYNDASSTVMQETEQAAMSFQTKVVVEETKPRQRNEPDAESERIVSEEDRLKEMEHILEFKRRVDKQRISDDAATLEEMKKMGLQKAEASARVLDEEMTIVEARLKEEASLLLEKWLADVRQVDQDLQEVEDTRLIDDKRLEFKAAALAKDREVENERIVMERKEIEEQRLADEANFSQKHQLLCEKLCDARQILEAERKVAEEEAKTQASENESKDDKNRGFFGFGGKIKKQDLEGEKQKQARLMELKLREMSIENEIQEMESEQSKMKEQAKKRERDRVEHQASLDEDSRELEKMIFSDKVTLEQERNQLDSRYREKQTLLMKRKEDLQQTRKDDVKWLASEEEKLQQKYTQDREKIGRMAIEQREAELLEEERLNRLALSLKERWVKEEAAFALEVAAFERSKDNSKLQATHPDKESIELIPNDESTLHQGSKATGKLGDTQQDRDPTGLSPSDESTLHAVNLLDNALGDEEEPSDCALPPEFAIEPSRRPWGTNVCVNNENSEDVDGNADSNSMGLDAGKSDQNKFIGANSFPRSLQVLTGNGHNLDASNPCHTIYDDEEVLTEPGGASDPTHLISNDNTLTEAEKPRSSVKEQQEIAINENQFETSDSREATILSGVLSRGNDSGLRLSSVTNESSEFLSKELPFDGQPAPDTFAALHTDVDEVTPHDDASLEEDSNSKLIPDHLAVLSQLNSSDAISIASIEPLHTFKPIDGQLNQPVLAAALNAKTEELGGSSIGLEESTVVNVQEKASRRNVPDHLVLLNQPNLPSIETVSIRPVELFDSTDTKMDSDKNFSAVELGPGTEEDHALSKVKVTDGSTGVPDHLVMLNQPLLPELSDTASIKPLEVFDPVVDDAVSDKPLLAAAIKAKNDQLTKSYYCLEGTVGTKITTSPEDFGRSVPDHLVALNQPKGSSLYPQSSIRELELFDDTDVDFFPNKPLLSAALKAKEGQTASSSSVIQILIPKGGIGSDDLSKSVLDDIVTSTQTRSIIQECDSRLSAEMVDATPRIAAQIQPQQTAALRVKEVEVDNERNTEDFQKESQKDAGLKRKKKQGVGLGSRLLQEAISFKENNISLSNNESVDVPAASADESLQPRESEPPIEAAIHSLSNATVIALLTSAHMDPTTSRSQERCIRALHSTGIKHDKLFGSDPVDQLRRNKLFSISGLPGVYPQFFILNKQGNTVFLGTGETIEQLHGAGELMVAIERKTNETTEVGPAFIDKLNVAKDSKLIQSTVEKGDELSTETPFKIEAGSGIVSAGGDSVESVLCSSDVSSPERLSWWKLNGKKLVSVYVNEAPMDEKRSLVESLVIHNKIIAEERAKSARLTLGQSENHLNSDQSRDNSESAEKASDNPLTLFDSLSEKRRKAAEARERAMSVRSGGQSPSVIGIRQHLPESSEEKFRMARESLLQRVEGAKDPAKASPAGNVRALEWAKAVASTGSPGVTPIDLDGTDEVTEKVSVADRLDWWRKNEKSVAKENLDSKNLDSSGSLDENMAVAHTQEPYTEVLAKCDEAATRKAILAEKRRLVVEARKALKAKETSQSFIQDRDESTSERIETEKYVSKSRGEIATASEGGASEVAPVGGSDRKLTTTHSVESTNINEKRKKRDAEALRLAERTQQARNNRLALEAEISNGSKLSDGDTRYSTFHVEQATTAFSIHSDETPPAGNLDVLKTAPPPSLLHPMIRETDRLSGFIRRYENKLETVCKSLLTVAGEDAGDKEVITAKELPFPEMLDFIFRRDWYTTNSTAAKSGAPRPHLIFSRMDQVNKESSKRAVLEAMENIKGDVSDDKAYAVTAVGKAFLQMDGPMQADVGRFLTHLDRFGDGLTRRVMMDHWRDIARLSGDIQSQRVLDKLDELISFCLDSHMIK